MANRDPYYEALEAADQAYVEDGQIDVSAMEQHLEAMPHRHLLSVAELASGTNHI
jgi:hypothetical protein